ncbi:MAG: hypothetical protein FWC87_05570 [Acidimicrobiaceae bacterium]|nr:hypothetical protein [Acidimicrobiaceae bacterium]
MPVGGNADDIRATAQTWGGHSQAAGDQANSVILAAEQMPPSVIVGPWADRLRSFAGEVRDGYSAVQSAYDRVASMLGIVAHAVEDAQDDERAMHRAKDAMTHAKQAWQLAQDQLEMATRLATSNPAWQSEVSAWARRCAELYPAVEQTTRAYQLAERAFEDADHHRQQALQTFAQLCEQEALTVERAIPQAPAGNFVDIAAADQLHRDAAALLDLPILASSGFAISHLAQVTRAVRSVNPASLDSWSRTVIQRATIKQHKGGGSIFTEGWHFIEKETSHFFHGAVGATVDLGKGLYNLFELLRPPMIPGTSGSPFSLSPGAQTLLHDLGQGVTHPGRLVTAVFNWQLLEKDPAKWLGALVPTIAIAAVTDGTGTLAARATDKAVDVTAPAIEDTAAGAARLADAVKKLDDPSVKLDWAKLGVAVSEGNVGQAEVDEAVLLYRSKQLLDAANVVNGTAGRVGTVEGLGSDKNEGPGSLADKNGEAFGRGLGVGLAGG